MGKRSRNFTGVAQFPKTINSAFEAPTPELTQNLHEAPPKEAHRPSPKKRKLNEKWDEIDVLQLVPKYTVESDVPEDLKKCAPYLCDIYFVKITNPRRLRAKTSVLLPI